MTQNIKIGVSASIGQVAGELTQVDAAADGLATAIDHVAKATKTAADEMTRLEAIAQRLKNVQGTLSKEFGKPVDAVDATIFLNNFEKMRSGKGIGNQRVRTFGSFEDWESGSATGFNRQADAERHRRFVMGANMRQTGYAAQNGIPVYPPMGGGSGGYSVQRRRAWRRRA